MGFYIEASRVIREGRKKPAVSVNMRKDETCDGL